MNELLKPTFDWIHDDYRTYPFRFCVELLAWAVSIGCSITMAATVPNPPLLILYPGLAAVLCMLGLVILGNHLACWLTTSC